VLVGIGGEVNSLFVVVALLSVEAWGSFVLGWCNKTKEISMSVSRLTQGLLHVLPISNLQNSRVSSCFLVYSSIVLLASCFTYLGKGLPSVGGIFQLTCFHCTKVSKS
jgi:hypothetical protein